MVQMIATIKPAHRDDFHRHSDQQCRPEREQRAEYKTARPGGEGCGEIRAQHVERPVRKIDEVHDAEHEGQPRGQQEQEQAELQPVQTLLDEKRHGTAATGSRTPNAHAAARAAA
jgi:hypothetical protein